MIIPLAQACKQILLEKHLPIATRYELWLIISKLYAKGEIDGEKLKLRKRKADVDDLNRVINNLLERRDLSRDRDFSSHVFRVHDTPDRTPEELCCQVDPFCCVSHLSAMEWYGFTNRKPASLILTTATPRHWANLAHDKQAADFRDILAEFRAQYAVRLQNYSLPHRVRGRSISLHRSKYYQPGVPVRSPNARVSEIGQTFLDMLLDPHLCGGMPHIIEVWAEHVSEHLQKIVQTVNRCSNKLAKVRAGYILHELLGHENSQILAWTQFTQRGGSQKLDPTKPYESKWSETWLLSLNV